MASFSCEISWKINFFDIIIRILIFFHNFFFQYVILLTVDIFHFILYSKKSYFFSNERKFNIPKVLRILKYHHIYIYIYRFWLFFWDPWCSSNFVKYKSKYDCVQNFSFLSRILASAFDFKVYIWLTWEKMTIFPNAPYSQKYWFN